MNVNQTLTSIQQSLTELIGTVGRIQKQLKEPIAQQLRPLPISGNVIWVYSHMQIKWIPRVFKEMTGNSVECYVNGRSKGSTSTWSEWEMSIDNQPTSPMEKT